MSFSNAPDNANEEAEILIYAVYVEKYEIIISHHFKLHYINKDMPVERLRKFMEQLEYILLDVKKIGLNTDGLNMKIDVYLKEWSSSTSI
ncbi:MAG: hypothetical protein ACI94Y_000353 [Maribacter sp.]